MTLLQCPECGHEIGTNSTSAGAFELPPTLACFHEEGEAYEMEVVSEADVKMDLVQ